MGMSIALDCYMVNDIMMVLLFIILLMLICNVIRRSFQIKKIHDRMENIIDMSRKDQIITDIK